MIGEKHPTTPARSGWQGRAESFVRSIWGPIVCWSVLFLEIVAWAAMRQGDAMVIPTLLAYGARWVWLIPVACDCPVVGVETIPPYLQRWPVRLAWSGSCSSSGLISLHVRRAAG